MKEYNTKQLQEDSKKYVWYPFTQMQEYMNDTPLIIAEGNGVYLKDTDGNEYIDGVSSIWTNVHGHNKKELNQAMKAQIDKISHSTLLGLSNPPAIELAKKIVEITPDRLQKVFYSDSGSTAVEIGLKIAYQYHQQNGRKKRNKFISFKKAYHGDTIGSVSVGGIDLFHKVYEKLIFDTEQVESPYCYRCPFGKEKDSCKMECTVHLEEVIKANAEETAGLIIEPLVQGAGGLITQPEGFLRKVRELCDKYNILMIADEVAVGFGKTGKMFACDKAGIEPDIICLAKGISGGYLPLAATVISEEIFNGFLGEHEEFKTFFHGHTYTGNPLACALAIENLKVFEEEKVVEKLQSKIALITDELEKYKKLEHVGDIRQQGIMVGIELVADKASKKNFPLKEKMGNQVIREARKQGLIIRPIGDVVIMMPPLAISKEELKKMLDITYNSIKKVTEDERN